jgi:hypothetical protein
MNGQAHGTNYPRVLATQQVPALRRTAMVAGTMAGTVTRRPGQYRANAGRRSGYQP